MSTTQPTPVVDQAEVDRLARALCHVYESLDDAPRVLASDVFVDSFPPQWRFQPQGRKTMLAQLRTVNDCDAVTSRLLRVVPTATGFVMEHEEAYVSEQIESARHLDLCEVRDGRVVEIVSYCNGGWDDALRARHAREAPMLRTDEEIVR